MSHDASLVSFLKNRFTTWCQKHGADLAAAEALWSSLSALYSEPQRHYHHLGHIRASLDELDRCAEDAAIEGAIWFHDVIYDPHRSDNEDASREWFKAGTQAWIDPVLAEKIAGLIDATDFRRSPADDADARLMIDIDLAILSADAAMYDAYCAAIRREYSHVSDEAFRGGRAKVMAGFLDRPIYCTGHFMAREERARANISRELTRLGNSPS